jgi:hypothetical protein
MIGTLRNYCGKLASKSGERQTVWKRHLRTEFALSSPARLPLRHCLLDGRSDKRRDPC